LVLPGLSEWARQQLEQCNRQIETPKAAESLWSEFRQCERERLGMSPRDAWEKYGTVGMWLRARQFDVPNETTRAIAILKIAVRLRVMWPQNADDLCRQLGET
jgi:hypothetical protein